MKKRKTNRMPILTMVLFVAASGLLLFSTIGGARAALTYYSENYTSSFEMFHIGVTLNENGDPVSKRDYDKNGNWKESGGALLQRELEPNNDIVLNKEYTEELTVTNSGDIDEYVRVTILKYWLDTRTLPAGKELEDLTEKELAALCKLTDLSPALIDLNLICDATKAYNEGKDNGWILDRQLTNSELVNDKNPGERTVLYYSKPLVTEEEAKNEGGESTTQPFADTLRIDGSIASIVSQTKTTEKTANGEFTTIVTTYKYNGVTFIIKAQVDAVQTHNAEDAILSAWGREVSIAEDGTLSLR